MSLRLALFFVSAATLMVELVLTRVFDVILTPNMAYMIVACALFSFGVAGVCLAVLPERLFTGRPGRLPALALAFSASVIALRPALNALPFDYEKIGEQPFVQLASFAAMYVVLAVPFLIAGFIIALLFSANAREIQKLYFWDLLGAAVGCVLIVPLLGPFGAGGILFVTAAFGLIAAGLLASDRRWIYGAVAAALVLTAAPVLRGEASFDFVEHLAKRGVRDARLAGTIEYSRWDPISKIDVIDQVGANPITGDSGPEARRKHIAYDGGNQSSHIFPFDGDYARLRAAIEDGSAPIWLHFWHRGVLASHRIKRDTGQRVLVIGSAGGQETKAALMYGASRVDAVEMVRTVVELMTGRYADYSGRIFLDPRVHVFATEGRSFLRATPQTYDIIQIHSNHTSSSIAAGTGAMAPNYLQTGEAYREYFTHLTADGVLQINHFGFARMITTAALAWRQMGRTDFQRHVLVLGMNTPLDTLPTLLIKMTPWTRDELDDVWSFYGTVGKDEFPFTILQDPTNPAASFLPPAFFSGDVTSELLDAAAVRLRPAVDDRPFFNFLRKTIAPLTPDRARFLDPATAEMLNSQLRKGIVPMDVIHLIVTGVVSLFFATASLLLPLFRSERRRTPVPSRYLSMVYFSCLGVGFILVELVFIQIFMKLIGYPVYTYVLVLFTLLLGAGIGSASSGTLDISSARRWTWPFWGILLYGSAFALAYPAIFDHFLAATDAVRMAVAAALILPLGCCLGMPFPLGILIADRQPAGAVAWAWGLNGAFTVVGSLASVLLGLAVGFRATILVAMGVYAGAFLVMSYLRRTVAEPALSEIPVTAALEYAEEVVR